MKANRLGSRLATVTLIGLVSMISGGCGIGLTHGPPEGHEQMDHFTCTESNVGPVLDVLTGLFYVIAGAVSTAEADDWDFSGDYYVVSGLLMGVAFGVSAGVGFNKTKKCKAAIQDLAARHAQGADTVRSELPPELVVQTVVLEPATYTLAVGERLHLTATAHNSDGDAVPHRRFSWSSSNDAIASVSSTGLVTAHANGTIVIAARTDNVVGTAEIVVVSRR